MSSTARNINTHNQDLVELYRVATVMKKAGLSDSFIASAVEFAREYKGGFDLMMLWEEETDPKEKEETIADIQEGIDDYLERPRGVVKKPYIKFDQLDAISSSIVKFKSELKIKVDRWGGISKLSIATGIPQPSLSRFFSSASMPRRTTIYKIADALGLSESEVVTEWIR